LRRILEYFGRRSRYPGDQVSVDPDAHPLFDVAELGHIGYLLNALREREDIAEAGNNTLGHPQWTLTIKGWERLAPRFAPGGVPGTVFVAMAFTPDMDAAFDEAIHPAIT
jgi:hypothetical protein